MQILKAILGSFIREQVNQQMQQAYYTIRTNGGVTSEQVHEQVQAALKQAHPTVVRDSVAAMNERMVRRPASAR